MRDSSWVSRYSRYSKSIIYGCRQRSYVMNVVRCLQISLVSAIALTTLAMGSFASADEPSNPPAGESPLPGTEPLTWSGDIASRLVDGADRFLLGELEKSVARSG